MTQVKAGDTVNVRYTARLEDGTVVDDNTGGAPLQFTVGEGEVIPGFEEAVVGMSPGESRTVEVPSEKAYGPYLENMTVEIARDQVPDDFEPTVGQQVQVRQADGRSAIVTVSRISDKSVILDANHPLAGKDLTFDIEVIEVV